MKLNIQITKKTGMQKDEKIVEIDIKNGNWKYWDDHMETTEKTSLTINNMRDAKYLSLPVKDAYGFFNPETKNIDEAMVRDYDSLHEYLICRINNAKEDFKSKICDIMEYKKTGRTYNAVLFEEKYIKSSEETITREITYEMDAMIEVKINWVE